MIAIAFQQSSIVTQLSFNQTLKQQLSKLPKPDVRPLIPGFHLMIVNNYKKMIEQNDAFNPEYPIVVAQAKP